MKKFQRKYTPFFAGWLLKNRKSCLPKSMNGNFNAYKFALLLNVDISSFFIVFINRKLFRKNWKRVIKSP